MSSLSWMFIFSLYLDLAEVLLFHLSCCVILAVLVLLLCHYWFVLCYLLTYQVTFS